MPTIEEENPSTHEKQSAAYYRELREIREELPEEIKDFADVFCSELPKHGEFDLAINIKEGAKIPRCRQRPMSRDESKEAKKQLDELISKGKVQQHPRYLF